jgi:proteasome lid subunit RPN8/RPN11
MNNIFFKNINDLLSFLRKESESSLLAELCSMIGLTNDGLFIYKQMQNRSKDPGSYFMIDPYDYLSFLKNFKPLCIFHSHLVGNEEASDFDIKTSENCCFCFLIYAITSEKFSLYEPHYKDYDVNIIQRLKELI